VPSWRFDVPITECPSVRTLEAPCQIARGRKQTLRSYLVIVADSDVTSSVSLRVQANQGGEMGWARTGPTP
jgi:hypothetical protein